MSVRGAARRAAFAGVMLAVGLPACAKDAAPRLDGGAAAPTPATLAATPASAPAPTSAPHPASGALRVTELGYAGAAGHRDDATFARGEELIALLSVSGFAYRGDRGRLLADLRVVGSDGALVLRKLDLALLDGKAPTRRPGTLRAAARLTLDPSLPAGVYRLRIDVRDEVSGRRGQLEGAFKLTGPPLPRAAVFSLVGLRNVGDQTVPAASVLPLAFTAAGLRPARDERGEHRLDLTLQSEIVDTAGKVLATHRQRLLRRALLFAPTSYPLRYALSLPATLVPGSYRARLLLEDLGAKAQARAELPFAVIPRTFSIVSPHLHDGGGLPRQRFRFGEQAFLRLAIQGFATRAEQADVAVDIAVAGPGGVYLAGKNAAQLSGPRSAAAARQGRFPLQLPLRLPALAPTGRYEVLLRVRDQLAKRDLSRTLRFNLEGTALAALGTFAVDQLQVRARADLPLLAGDTFVSGRSYHLTVRAGGGRAAKVKRATYRLKILGTLRLRSTNGTVVGSWKDLFRYERTLHYQPLRVLLPASWTVPAGLPRALYDLEIELLVPERHRVSTLRKRIEVLAGR